MLDIHLNVLNDYVDEFIIVEANRTFSGKQKPLYFEEHRDYFSKFLPKIKYYVVDDWLDTELWNMAKNSPNTRGAEHWKMEFYIKESIKKALTHLKDDDIVFIGDVDEIWEPEISSFNGVFPNKLKLHVYTYFLNNSSSEEFWGTLVSKYKHIKNECLNHLRTYSHKTDGYGGWHFTSMGGYEEVKRKLTDSYTKDSYAHDAVMNNLKNSIENSQDFLGRGFTYTIDESEWPQWLKDNRESYTHLLRK